MNRLRNPLLSLAAGLVALAVSGHSVRAQAYPSKPITIVVPFAAGGATDTIARVLADRMRSTLGQTLIVETATGAGGTIGVARAVRAAPDGYTLSFGQNGSHVITGATYSKLTYDLLTDLEPVSLVSVAPFIISGRKTLPANNLKELVAWMKANPGKATIGNAGVGSITHVSALLFQDASGTQAQSVPYRGNAPAMHDMVAGQIDLMMADPITAIPQIRGGTIKPFAITDGARLPSAPEVPTVDEAGFPGVHVSLWHGLWVPKGTPQPIVAKLAAAVAEALADPATRAKLAEAGQQIFPREKQNPEALRALQKADIERWWPIIKAGNIKTD